MHTLNPDDPLLLELNAHLGKYFNTRLKGGFSEPFYRAPKAEHIGELQFRENFLRSALHELSHWCIAGKERREMDDFGYWYSEDGRSQDEQNAFYQSEVKPQAIEKHFCEALFIPFEVSADNLDGKVVGIEDFQAAVDAQYRVYLRDGFPPRVPALYAIMKQYAVSST